MYFRYFELESLPSSIFLCFVCFHKSAYDCDIDWYVQWIDDNNCLVIFKDPKLMQTALKELSDGIFKVKAYSDSNYEDNTSSNGIVTLCCLLSYSFSFLIIVDNIHFFSSVTSQTQSPPTYSSVVKAKTNKGTGHLPSY
jgi:hypothetical protein